MKECAVCGKETHLHCGLCSAHVRADIQDHQDEISYLNGKSFSHTPGQLARLIRYTYDGVQSASLLNLYTKYEGHKRCNMDVLAAIELNLVTITWTGHNRRFNLDVYYEPGRHEYGAACYGKDKHVVWAWQWADMKERYVNTIGSFCAIYPI